MVVVGLRILKINFAINRSRILTIKIILKINQVTLATPTLGLFIIHRPLCSTPHGLSNKEKTSV